MVLLLLHGIIHFMGFAKSFELASIEQLTKVISKPFGIFWFFYRSVINCQYYCIYTQKRFWTFLIVLAKESDTPELVSEKDLDVLPKPVQNYLNYAGVVGKPKVKSKTSKSLLKARCGIKEKIGLSLNKIILSKTLYDYSL